MRKILLSLMLAFAPAFTETAKETPVKSYDLVYQNIVDTTPLVHKWAEIEHDEISLLISYIEECEKALENSYDQDTAPSLHLKLRSSFQDSFKKKKALINTYIVLDLFESEKDYKRIRGRLVRKNFSEIFIGYTIGFVSLDQEWLPQVTAKYLPTLKRLKASYTDANSATYTGSMADKERLGGTLIADLYFRPLFVKKTKLAPVKLDPKDKDLNKTLFSALQAKFNEDQGFKDLYFLYTKLMQKDDFIIVFNDEQLSSKPNFTQRAHTLFERYFCAGDFK